MEIIRRNSPEFRQLKDIFDEYQQRSTRKRSLLLYALRPGHPLNEKTLLNSVKENGEVLYDLQYETVMEMFRNRAFKLYRDRNFLYCFRKSAAGDIESPFQMKGAPRETVEELLR